MDFGVGADGPALVYVFEGHVSLGEALDVAWVGVVGVVLPLVVDHVARPELADDRYRLSEPLGTLRVGVPFACGGFFVDGLARAHAEEDATGVEQSQGSEALRYDGGAVAVNGHSDA